MSLDAHPAPPSVTARRLGLFTQQDVIVVMRRDCHICRAEGLLARSQVLLRAHGREVYATLYQIDGELIGTGEAALSEEAWRLLGVQEGEPIRVSHPPTLASMSSVRRRIYGSRLAPDEMAAIVRDVAAGRYTPIHLTAFLTSSSALPLDEAETVALTQAMVEVGDRLVWDAPVIVDKHSVGGLPGNRTTPIVVAILAANGLIIPKTSSRAITSPAGTADTMETLAPIDLDVSAMRRVVEAEGGCIVWGGAVRLSPADDIFIRIERVLDVDTEGQLVASVLSKKVAAGSSHVVLDLPVGPTAKVRGPAAAEALASRLSTVAAHFGMAVRCVFTDGSQPVGRGIGPALEAREVLAILQGAPDAPADLRQRACALAGAALELAKVAPAGAGARQAEATLDDGRAWTKFQRICEAQGGMRTPPTAPLASSLNAARSGRVVRIDNRKVALLAKLAGAPDSKAAGLSLNARVGEEVIAGEPLLFVHAQTTGELDYALDYASGQPDMIEIAS